MHRKKFFSKNSLSALRHLNDFIRNHLRLYFLSFRAKRGNLPRDFFPRCIIGLVIACAIICGIVLPAAIRISAEVPHLINYQGRLLQEGIPVTGTKSVNFKILSSESGGNILWEETQNGISITDGIFNVLLGSVSPIPTNVFSSQSETWLETTIDGTSLGRQRLVSVGYAFKAGDADKLDNKDSADFLDTSATGQTKNGSLSLGSNLTVDGKLGIGTTAPGLNLDLGPTGDMHLGNGRSIQWGNLSKPDRAMIYGYDDGRFLIGGNVGIGTTNPGRKLQVAGGTNLQDFLIVGADVSPAQLLHVEGNAYMKGNVGIGTPSPGEKLEVSGNTKVTGNLTVWGTKSAVVETENYGKRKLYVREGPENKFIDEGEAELKNGEARVYFENIFKEAIENDNYLVQLTPLNEIISLAVTERSPDYFVVKGSNNSNTRFMWQVSAYRKGMRNIRLEEVIIEEKK